MTSARDHGFTSKWTFDMTVWDMDCVFLKHLIRGSLNSGIGKYNERDKSGEEFSYFHAHVPYYRNTYRDLTAF